MRPRRLIALATLAYAASACAALLVHASAQAQQTSTVQEDAAANAKSKQPLPVKARANEAAPTAAVGKGKQAKSDQAKSDQAKSDQAKSDQRKSDHAKSDQAQARRRVPPNAQALTAPKPSDATVPARAVSATPPGGFFAAVAGAFARPPALPATPAPPKGQAQVPAPSATAAMAHAPRVAEPIILAPTAGVAAAVPTEPPYVLDSGDRLRIVIFGQDGLSNSYFVDAAGNVTVPLIGPVPARGKSTLELSHAIAERLRRGFIREPHVAVEVEIYRPFFILGEVTFPGQYPYVPNMTVETAVAIAGGFSPRAYRWEVYLDRPAPGTLARARASVPLLTRVQPGDTLVIKERWF
jgi:polysaccharide export outer membrane protein